MQNKFFLKSLFLVVLIIFSTTCKVTDPNKVSTSANDTSTINLISEDDAKAVVIENIQTSEMYRQYYILESPNFDERVRSISWGETILIKRIPNKKYNTKDGYYYLLTGVLPDSHILVIQIVDAQTGENTRGQRLLDSDCDVLRIITPSESIEYAKKYVKGNLKAQAIYFYDGTLETGYEHLTWRYLVQPIDSDAITRGFTGTDYILLDPYVQNFKDDNTIKSTNGFLSRVNYPHRAFRIDSSRENEDGKKMVPVD